MSAKKFHKIFQFIVFSRCFDQVLTNPKENLRNYNIMHLKEEGKTEYKQKSKTCPNGKWRAISFPEGLFVCGYLNKKTLISKMRQFIDGK